MSSDDIFLRRDTSKERSPNLDAILRSEPDEEERPEPPCRVLLHNDDVTPIEYVPRVLERVFKLGGMRALWITIKAHAVGFAQVVVEPCSKAEAHVAEAHEMARADGNMYLTFSVEPTEE